MPKISEKAKANERRVMKAIIYGNFVVAIMDLLLIPYGMTMPDFSEEMLRTQILSAILFTIIGIVMVKLDKKRPLTFFPE